MPLLPPVTLSLEDQLRALQSAAGARVLDPLAVLAIRGKDRATWLNGIITHDVKKLSVGDSTYAAAVAVKGRILTDLFVYVRADDVLLSLPKSRLADLTAHLDRFIVMEDVTLEATDLVVLSVQGPSSDAATAGLPDRFRADRLGASGFDVLTAPDHAEYPLNTVSVEAWEQTRINAGIPAFEADFDLTNFVQEAAITPRAVSFHKGCYVGQEMVCRLEMRGHVQKLLVGLTIEGSAHKGDAVLSGDASVGAITSVAPSTHTPGHTAAIAMIKYAAAEKREPLTVQGASATLKSLT